MTKLVSEHEFSLLNFKLMFCVFLHYCGIRLSNVSFVVIASSILRCVCFVIVSGFICLVFFVERRARDAPAAKVAMMLSSPFRTKLLLLLLDVEEEIAMVEECCLRLYLLCVILEMDLLA